MSRVLAGDAPPWALAAAALAAVAVLLAGLRRTAASDRLRRVCPRPGPSRPRRPQWMPTVAALATAAGAGFGVVTSSPGLILMPGAALIAVAWRRGAALRRQASRAARLRELSRELCRATAAEVRAGLDPYAALVAALAPLLDDDTAGASATGVDAQARRVLLPVAAAARSRGDVGAALARAALAPGAVGLSRLAVCWTVAVGTGAGLAQALDRVGDGLDAEEEMRRDVQAQLAGPRASAGMLSVLPVLGVAMATGLGGNPVTALTGTGWGRACLAGGVGLTVLGRWWTDRMARAVLP